MSDRPVAASSIQYGTSGGLSEVTVTRTADTDFDATPGGHLVDWGDVRARATDRRLDLVVEHAFADLTEWERFAVARRYGLDGPPCSMKELAHQLECSHAEARDLLGGALVKLRARLTSSS